MDDYGIRWIIRADLEELVAIENEVQTSPFSNKEIIKTLRDRNCVGKLIYFRGEIGGFIIYTLEKDTIQVLRLTVKGEYQGEGLGTRLVSDLKHKLSKYKRTSLFVYAPEENLQSQLFFSSLGFTASEITTDGEQVFYVMEYDLETELQLKNRIKAYLRN